MKVSAASALCLFACLSCAVGAHAGTGAADSVAPAVGTRGAYMSAMLGNGRVYGANDHGDAGMHWRAMDVRFGSDLDAGSLVPSSFLSGREKLRADVVYYNEGHPSNNHRDGFALQLVYANRFRRNLAAEFGIGPYLSMNTTNRDGTEINDSHVGALLSLALRIGLDRYSPGLHLRLGINRVAMHRAFSSTALMAGLGKTFPNPPARPAGESGGGPVWIGIAGVASRTNHAGADLAYGLSIEGKRYWNSWAASVAALAEGDDGRRVDRRGIAVQGWYVQPLTGKWSVSAGAGPYLAKDLRSADDFRLNGLFSIRAERTLSDTMKFFASFSRVKTFREVEDRDLCQVGIMKQFGG